MKLFKRILAVFTAAVVLVSMSGCSNVEKAQNALDSTMSALQSGDIAAASKHINDIDELSSSDMFSSLEGQGDFGKTLFSKMSYSINSSEEVDESTVKFNVDITTVDMSVVFSNMISQIFSLALSNAFASGEEQMSEDEMKDKMFELLADGINAEDAATVTNTVDVNVVKTDDGWKVDVTDTVLDMVTGGLVSAAQSLGSAFGG